MKYALTDKGEQCLPIFSTISGKEMAALPIALCAVISRRKILLMKRDKRPYQGYWGFIGGKVTASETIAGASVRLVKEKASISTDYVALNSVFHERVVQNQKIKHGFILFLSTLSASAPDVSLKGINPENLKFFSKKELKGLKLIPSDEWLLKHKLTSQIDVPTALMHEKDDLIERFELLQA